MHRTLRYEKGSSIAKLIRHYSNDEICFSVFLVLKYVKGSSIAKLVDIRALRIKHTFYYVKGSSIAKLVDIRALRIKHTFYYEKGSSIAKLIRHYSNGD